MNSFKIIIIIFTLFILLISCSEDGVIRNKIRSKADIQMNSIIEKDNQVIKEIEKRMINLKQEMDFYYTAYQGKVANFIDISTKEAYEKYLEKKAEYDKLDRQRLLLLQHERSYQSTRKDIIKRLKNKYGYEGSVEGE